MTLFLQFYARLYAVGVAVANESLPVVVRSRVDCMTLCLKSTTCASFFFNPQMKSCYLQNTWIANLTNSAIQTDTNYFLIHPSPCWWDGYQMTTNGSLCVRVSEVTQNWTEAKWQCESEGAELMKVDTEEKLVVVWDVLSPHYDDQDIFIGAHEPDHNGTFVWVDGSLVAGGWGPGRPNKFYEDQYCVALKAGQGFNDVRCGHARYYICEKTLYR